MKGFKLISYSFSCLLAGLAIMNGVENSVLMGNQIGGGSDEGLISLPQSNENTFTRSFWSSALDSTEGLGKLNRFRTIMQDWKEKTGHAVFVQFEPEDRELRPRGVIALTRWLSPSPSESSIRNRQKRSANWADTSLGNSLQQSGNRDQRYRMTRSPSRFPEPFCELEIDSGIICPGVRRGLRLEQFHYDVDNNRCSYFVYNGCGGNANRFSSLWECTQSCVKQSIISK